MVDAKDEAVAAFYRHHGFIALPGLPLTLFLPLATAIASRKTDNKRFSPISESFCGGSLWMEPTSTIKGRPSFMVGVSYVYLAIH